MPITYIGRQSDCIGKPLFHILANLKNFGIGRMVVRGIYERYPEPTYYIIKRVHPFMDEKNLLGVVWADLVFRGRKISELKRLHCSYKPDFKLIPKEEEEAYYSYPVQEIPVKRVSKYSLLPPLLEMSLKQQMKMKGKVPPSGNIKMEMKYLEDNIYYRIETVDEPEVIRYKANINPKFLTGIKNIEEEEDAH